MKIILLLALAGSAAAQEIKPCPELFPADAVRIRAPGWVGVVSPVLRLTGADVAEIEPGNGAMIGRERKTRGGREVTYEPGAPAWLACRYGDLALAQRLPEKTDRCVVSYVRNEFGGYGISVACHMRPDSSHR